MEGKELGEVICPKCKMNNPVDLISCVRCGSRLEEVKKYDKQLWIEPEELPKNPSSEEIDFNKDGQTYVVLFMIKMDPKWYELPREKRIQISRDHMKTLSPYANKINRTLLWGVGMSKYDFVEIVEADDLKIVSSLIHAVKTGAKGAYINIVDSVATLKGKTSLVRSMGARRE